MSRPRSTRKHSPCRVKGHFPNALGMCVVCYTQLLTVYNKRGLHLFHAHTLLNNIETFKDEMAYDTAPDSVSKGDAEMKYDDDPVGEQLPITQFEGKVIDVIKVIRVEERAQANSVDQSYKVAILMIAVHEDDGEITEQEVFVSSKPVLRKLSSFFAKHPNDTMDGVIILSRPMGQYTAFDLCGESQYEMVQAQIANGTYGQGPSQNNQAMRGNVPQPASANPLGNIPF